MKITQKISLLLISALCAISGCAQVEKPMSMLFVEGVLPGPDSAPPAKAMKVYSDLCTQAGIHVYNPPPAPIKSIAFLHPIAGLSMVYRDYYKILENIESDDVYFVDEYPQAWDIVINKYVDWAKTYKLNRAEIEMSDGRFARWSVNAQGAWQFDGYFKTYASPYTMTWGKSPNFDHSFEKGYLINDGYLEVRGPGNVLVADAVAFVIVPPPFHQWGSRFVCGLPPGESLSKKGYGASVEGLLLDINKSTKKEDN